MSKAKDTTQKFIIDSPKTDWYLELVIKKNAVCDYNIYTSMYINFYDMF